MTSVREIEQAVQQLAGADLAAFRQWFAEFDAGVWDRQLEQDAAAGRLDDLAHEARGDVDQGRCTDL